MKYVLKPVPVEAILADSPGTCLRWLQPGEHSLVSNTAIFINTVARKSVKVKYGEAYLVRDEVGVTVVPKDRFEEIYMPLDTVAEAEFAAHLWANDTWAVECITCDTLVGVADNKEEMTEISHAHMLDLHREN